MTITGSSSESSHECPVKWNYCYRGRSWRFI